MKQVNIWWFRLRSRLTPTATLFAGDLSRRHFSHYKKMTMMLLLRGVNIFLLAWLLSLRFEMPPFCIAPCRPIFTAAATQAFHAIEFPYGHRSFLTWFPIFIKIDIISYTRALIGSCAHEFARYTIAWGARFEWQRRFRYISITRFLHWASDAFGFRRASQFPFS